MRSVQVGMLSQIKYGWYPYSCLGRDGRIDFVCNTKSQDIVKILIEMAS